MFGIIALLILFQHSKTWRRGVVIRQSHLYIFTNEICAVGDIMIPKCHEYGDSALAEKALIVISCSLRRQILVFAISEAKKETYIFMNTEAFIEIDAIALMFSKLRIKYA